MALIDNPVEFIKQIKKGVYRGSTIRSDNDLFDIVKALIQDCNVTYDECGYTWKFLPNQFSHLDCECGSFITKLQPDKNSHAVLTIHNTELELHYNDLFMILDKPKKPRYYHRPRIDKDIMYPLILEDTDMFNSEKVKRVILNKVRYTFDEFGANHEKLPLYAYLTGSVYLEKISDKHYTISEEFYYKTFISYLTVTISSESSLEKNHKLYYRGNPQFDPHDSNTQSFPANVLPIELVNSMLNDILDIVNKE